MKKQMFSRLSQLTLAMACAAMLTACGGGGGGDDDKGSSGGGSNTEQPSKPGNGGNDGNSGVTPVEPNKAFDPASTVTTPKDDNTERTYGEVSKPVSYVFHKRDKSVIKADGTRYGTPTNWKIDLGLQVLELYTVGKDQELVWGGFNVRADSRAFSNEDALLICTEAKPEMTNVAINATAQVATLEQLAGDFNMFSCDNLKGDTAELTINADGSAKTKSGAVVNASQMLHADGWTQDGVNRKARGYLLSSGVKAIVVKEEGGDSPGIYLALSGAN